MAEKNLQADMENYLRSYFIPIQPSNQKEVAAFLVGIVNKVNAQIDATGEYNSDEIVGLPQCLYIRLGDSSLRKMRVEDVINWFGLWRTNFFHNVNF